MAPAATTADPAIPRSVERVLDLLEIALAEPGCTLTAAAAEAELTPTTALRYLRALEHRGYLDRDPEGRFHPGATVLRISAALHEQGPLERLVAIAQPLLDELAATTGESVYLVVADARTATYVATAESARAIRHVGWVGQNVPLEGTAVGAALAAPGEPIIRTGAVEPDITAISLGLGPVHSMRLAVSIVGPDQRLATDAERNRASVALANTVAQLRAALGLATHDQEVAS
jgi:DNA-binding IclR family transcriptional regulator